MRWWISEQSTAPASRLRAPKRRACKSYVNVHEIGYNERSRIRRVASNIKSLRMYVESEQHNVALLLLNIKAKAKNLWFKGKRKSPCSDTYRIMCIKIRIMRQTIWPHFMSSCGGGAKRRRQIKPMQMPSSSVCISMWLRQTKGSILPRLGRLLGFVVFNLTLRKYEADWYDKVSDLISIWSAFCFFVDKDFSKQLSVHTSRGK